MPYLTISREGAPQRRHDLREVFDGPSATGNGVSPRGASQHTRAAGAEILGQAWSAPGEESLA